MADDSVFSDTPVVETTRDILSLTMTEKIDMPDNIFQSLRYRAMQTTDVKTQGQLKHRIMEYLHISSLQNHPLRLATLSRRFSRLCKKLGLPMPIAIADLVQSGHITTLKYKEFTGLFSTSVFNEQAAARAQFESEGMPSAGDHVESLMQALDGIEPSFGSVPKGSTREAGRSRV